MLLHTDLMSIFKVIEAPKQAKDYVLVGQPLTTHIETLLNVGDIATASALLADLPPDLVHENLDLCYAVGLVQARSGQIQQAIQRLDRARFAYTASQHIEQAVRCSLELARLYCSREAFQTAYYHLCDYVRPWVEAGYVRDATLRACFYLCMAEITPDIGRFSETIGYARQALALYQATNNLYGQYFTLVRLAAALLHLADDRAAATAIAQAKACLIVGDFGSVTHARVLNLESHYHWHRGRLQEAIVVAKHYLTLVDEEPASNFRAYARMLLANLYRDLGQFTEAATWYTATRQITADLAYHLYEPWLDAQVAWLYLLQGELALARRYSYASLQTADLGQTMSFQVTLAVLHLLEGHYTVAERLLTESLAFYTQSGDELAVCTLHCYLALVAQRQEQTALVHDHLAQALGWLAQRHLDYLPYWWHPTLLSEILAQALVLDLYLDVVEPIFLNHLRSAGKAALRLLLQGQNPVATQKAYRLLRTMGNTVFELVAHLPNGPAKEVLVTLLESDQLCPAAYPRLERELMTAMRRPKPNPTLMAVFGLYVNGATREEIAERLDCSLPGVRNYITAIYEHFEVTTAGFPTRRRRWKSLVAVAQAKGFVH